VNDEPGILDDRFDRPAGAEIDDRENPARSTPPWASISGIPAGRMSCTGDAASPLTSKGYRHFV